MHAVNAGGDVFLSHTKLHGRFTLRLAIGNIRTEERHVALAWERCAKRRRPDGEVAEREGANSEVPKSDDRRIENGVSE